MSHRRSQKGFTLIEIMIVLLLTGIILFMVSRLTSETFKSLRFLQEKSQTLQSATLGLERLTSELREAVRVNTVSPLNFDKINPAAPVCLGNDPNAPNPVGTWVRDYSNDANGDNQIGVVEYRRDVAQQILTRTATLNGRTMTTEVAVNVNDFVVQRGPTLGGNTTGRNVFQVTLTLQEQRRAVTFVSLLTVPGEQI